MINSNELIDVYVIANLLTSFDSDVDLTYRFADVRDTSPSIQDVLYSSKRAMKCYRFGTHLVDKTTGKTNLQLLEESFYWMPFVRIEGAVRSNYLAKETRTLRHIVKYSKDDPVGFLFVQLAEELVELASEMSTQDIPEPDFY